MERLSLRDIVKKEQGASGHCAGPQGWGGHNSPGRQEMGTSWGEAGWGQTERTQPRLQKEGRE